MSWPGAVLLRSRRYPMRDAPELSWSSPLEQPAPRQVLLINPFYPKDPLSSYGQQAWPARDLLPRCSFLTTTSVIATRGCHNRCGFCYLSTKGLHMPCQVRDPEDVVRAMARSGCTGVFVGLETLEAKNLEDAGKRSCPPSDYARRIRIFPDHGIQVNGSFVLGFDHDDAGVFDRTIDWIEEQRLECATFQILTPYPGTPLFDQMLAEGRILHRDWSRYDTAHVVFQPRRMSGAQLQEGYRRCCTRLFSHRSIWRRRPEDPRAIPAYLAMSYLY